MRRVVLALALCLAGTGSARAQPADWGAKRAPFDAETARRWQAVLAKNPWDAGALTQLRAMYQRYKSLAALEATYAGATDAASLIVLARLAPTDLSRWQRVVAVAEDPRALAALADIELSLRHPEVAMTHYERAVAANPPNELKREMLRKMISVIEPDKRVDPIEKLYTQLIDLDPKDGHVWVDRGISLQKLGLHDKAAAAFGSAIALLRTDPGAVLDATMLQARAFQLAAKPKAAQLAYERILATEPRGYYLQGQTLDALISLHQSEGTLDELLTQLDKRFPAGHRSHDEWRAVAKIHEQRGDYQGELDALRKAVAAAPGETQTQRLLIAMLDSYGKSEEALAQFERAVKAAPSDSQLQIDLAIRYRKRSQTANALATLVRLSRFERKDARVHRDLADLFRKWDRPGLALAELEEIARIEPSADSLTTLGEAYWTAGAESKALAAWKRIGTTVDALVKRAEVYNEHDLFADALAVYAQAIEKEPTNVALLIARSELYDSTGDSEDAYFDASNAVALSRGTTLDAGHAARQHLDHLLHHWREHDDSDADHSQGVVDTWTHDFAADPPDIEAGYLLAENYSSQPDEQLLDVLDKLHRLRPDDLGVARTLARTYRVLHRYDDAMATLAALSTADPTHAQQYAQQIDDMKDARANGEGGWSPENIPDPEDELARFFHRPDAIAAAHLGFRMGVGTGLRGPADHSVLVGMYTELRIAHHLAFVARLDWSERGTDMSSLHAAALATGVAMPIVEFKDAVITLGVAHRTELRVGNHMGWDRIGLAGDATLEVIPKHLPATFDVRFEQGVSDHAQASALMFELGGGL